MYTRCTSLVLLVLIITLGGRPAAADRSTKAQVRQQLAELRDALEAPGHTVADAARSLRTPERALAFVRDQVAYVPYRGAWHDAEATLRLRVANATDKAVLLGALLGAMQLKVRLVRAPWPTAARVHHARSRPWPKAALQRVIETISPTMRKPLSNRTARALQLEVATALRTLDRTLADSGLSARLHGTPRKTQPSYAPVHWAWVQVLSGLDTWTDMDPTLPTRARPAKGGTPFQAVAAKATVRVLADKQIVATWTGKASTLLAHGAQILFLPEGGGPAAADTPGAVGRWYARLQLGSHVVRGSAFAPGRKAAPPVPAFNPFGRMAAAKAAGTAAIRLEVMFDEPNAATRQSRGFGRTIMRFTKGFDPQQLVSMYRIGAGVGIVPLEVTAARQIDEILDLADLHAGVDLSTNAASRSQRGISARAARILNALAVLQPTLLEQPIALAWQGPAVFVESVSLATRGASVDAVARIDIWNRAFGPAKGVSRRARAEWGLATLAVEGHLLRSDSVNTRMTASAGSLEVLTRAKDARRVVDDEIAAETLRQGGIVLVRADAPGVTWSLPASGDLLGTITTRGATAKGGETRSEAAGRGYAALGNAALGALGSPAGMLVGGIAAYLNELAKAFGGAARVLNGLADTMATGDDKYILQAIGKYRGDFARRMARALAEGLARGWAEAALSAGIGHALPPGTNPFGPTMGDRARDGAVAGGLGYPQELPILSDLIRGAFDLLME